TPTTAAAAAFIARRGKYVRPADAPDRVCRAPVSPYATGPVWTRERTTTIAEVAGTFVPRCKAAWRGVALRPACFLPPRYVLVAASRSRSTPAPEPKPAVRAISPRPRSPGASARARARLSRAER